MTENIICYYNYYNYNKIKKQLLKHKRLHCLNAEVIVVTKLDHKGMEQRLDYK